MDKSGKGASKGSFWKGLVRHVGGLVQDAGGA